MERCDKLNCLTVKKNPTLVNVIRLIYNDKDKIHDHVTFFFCKIVLKITIRCTLDKNHISAKWVTKLLNCHWRIIT